MAPSILPTFKKDLFWFYGPGVLAILLSLLILEDKESLTYIIYAFIATGFLDSGHVYVTLWRTYLNPQELRRNKVYIFLPLFWFFLFLAWIVFRWPYLSSFVIYVTVFHNFRQFFGISRWYQKLNKQFSKLSDFFLHLLCLLPFVVLHFRSDKRFISYYANDELFSFPNPMLYKATLIFMSFMLMVWGGFEVYRMRKYRDFNRTLTVLFPSLIYYYAFVVSRTLSQALFPILISHAVSYFVLNYKVLPKINPKYFTAKRAFGAIILTALVFGTLEFFFEHSFLSLTSIEKAVPSAVILSILFCHYSFDAFLWKRSHPDAPSIYGS